MLLIVLIDIIHIVMLDIFGDGPRPIAWNPSDGMWYCKAPMFTTGVATSWGSPPTGFADLTFQLGGSGDQAVLMKSLHSLYFFHFHSPLAPFFFLLFCLSFSIYVLYVCCYHFFVFFFTHTYTYIYTHRWR